MADKSHFSDVWRLGQAKQLLAKGSLTHAQTLKQKWAVNPGATGFADLQSIRISVSAFVLMASVTCDHPRLYWSASFVTIWKTPLPLSGDKYWRAPLCERQEAETPTLLPGLRVMCDNNQFWHICNGLDVGHCIPGDGPPRALRRDPIINHTPSQEQHKFFSTEGHIPGLI